MWDTCPKVSGHSAKAFPVPKAPEVQNGPFWALFGPQTRKAPQTPPEGGGHVCLPAQALQTALPPKLVNFSLAPRHPAVAPPPPLHMPPVAGGPWGDSPGRGATFSGQTLLIPISQCPGTLLIGVSCVRFLPPRRLAPFCLKTISPPQSSSSAMNDSFARSPFWVVWPVLCMAHQIIVIFDLAPRLAPQPDLQL